MSRHAQCIIDWHRDALLTGIALSFSTYQHKCFLYLLTSHCNAFELLSDIVSREYCWHRAVLYLKIHGWLQLVSSYCNVFNTLTPGSLSLWRMQSQCIGTQGANLARGICAFLAWGFPRTWALTDLAPGARCSMIHLEWHTTYWVEWLWPICTVHCLPSYPLQNLTCMPKAQRPKSQRVLRL